MPSPPPLAIYPSRFKSLVLLAISFALLSLPIVAVMLFWTRIDEIQTASYRLYALLWIGIGLFVFVGFAGFAFNLRQLVLPKPVVTIRPRGIELFWFGLIPWQEINRIAKVRHRGQWMLGIYPKDTDEFLSRQTSLGRSIMKRAIEQGFPPVYVPQLALPISLNELLVEIRRYTDVPISDLAT